MSFVLWFLNFRAALKLRAAVISIEIFQLILIKNETDNMIRIKNCNFYAKKFSQNQYHLYYPLRLWRQARWFLLRALSKFLLCNHRSRRRFRWCYFLQQPTIDSPFRKSNANREIQWSHHPKIIIIKTAVIWIWTRDHWVKKNTLVCTHL